MSQRSPSLVVGSGQSLAQLRPTEVSFKVGGDLVSQRLNRVLWDRHIFVSSYQRLFAFIWVLYWRPRQPQRTVAVIPVIGLSNRDGASALRP